MIPMGYKFRIFNPIANENDSQRRGGRRKRLMIPMG